MSSTSAQEVQAQAVQAPLEAPAPAKIRKIKVKESWDDVTESEDEQENEIVENEMTEERATLLQICALWNIMDPQLDKLANEVLRELITEYSNTAEKIYLEDIVDKNMEEDDAFAEGEEYDEYDEGEEYNNDEGEDEEDYFDDDELDQYDKKLGRYVAVR
jgi:hypothetical protein